MKRDCTEDLKCETGNTTSATIRKAYDALVFVVLGGLRAWSATKFSKTHVITHETSVMLLPLRYLIT